jgi:hypothetical protein
VRQYACAFDPRVLVSLDSHYEDGVDNVVDDVASGIHRHARSGLTA